MIVYNKPESQYEIVSPFLCEDLISSECRDEIKRLNSKFSNLKSPLLIFESNLSDKEPLLDYSFVLDSTSENLFALKEIYPHIFWEKVHDFSSEHIWLEFDTGSGVNKELPNIFFSTQNQVCQRGFMLARKSSDMRLIIKLNSFNSSTVLNSLKEFGYESDVGILLDLLNKLVPFLDYICLSIDIGRKRLGIECYTPIRAGNESWRDFFSALNIHLSLRASKIKAVLDWCGYHVFSDQHTHTINHRNINHCKLVFSPDSEMIAKAYLSTVIQQLA